MKISNEEKVFELHPRVEYILNKFSNSRTKSSFLAKRSIYVIRVSHGDDYKLIAQETKVYRETVAYWAKNFKANIPYLNGIATDSPKDLEKAIIETLSDKHRTGAPRKYSPEVYTAVVFLCCHRVCEFDLVANRWTLSLLQFALIELGIVEDISVGTIYQILKSVDLCPWKNRYYLFSKDRVFNYQNFKEQVQKITLEYIVSNIHRDELKSQNLSIDEECVVIRPSKAQEKQNITEESNNNKINSDVKDVTKNSDIDETKSNLANNASNTSDNIEESDNVENISGDFDQTLGENIITQDNYEENNEINKSYANFVSKDYIAHNLKMLEEKFGFPASKFDNIIGVNNFKEINKISCDINFCNAFNIKCENDNDRPRLFYNQLEQAIKDNYPAYYYENKNKWFNFYSMDEDSGIQAIERRHSDILPTPKTSNSDGTPHLIEFNYDRHGTTGIIAYRNVITGKIPCVYINQTRTERDLVHSLYPILENNISTLKVGIICDNLNTHQSEALVLASAIFSGLNIDLGIKGKSGILQNAETRSAFLSDPTHRLYFTYTPVHSSWLNQIETDFSRLQRNFLHKNSFKSVEELEDMLESYFNQYNKYFAKPVNWKYNSVPKVPNESLISQAI